MLDQSHEQELLKSLLPDGYDLRYDPAEDASVDDAYRILKDGAPTAYSIQVLKVGGGYGLSESLYKPDGDLRAARSHAMADRVADLKPTLQRLLG